MKRSEQARVEANANRFFLMTVPGREDADPCDYFVVYGSRSSGAMWSSKAMNEPSAKVELNRLSAMTPAAFTKYARAARKAGR